MENPTKLKRRRWAVQLAFTTGLAVLLVGILLWGLQGLAWGHAALESSKQPPGFFTDSGQDVGGGADNVVALGDLDGDGDLDAFVRNQIWENDGYGYFSDSGQILNLPGDLKEMALGDVDGDDDLDAVFASGSSDPNQVWLNDGSGLFTNSGQNLGGADSWALAIGDVDGDDDLDVLFADSGGHSLWLNDGTGVFTDSNQNLGNSGVRAVALQDLDGDRDFDAFFADCTIWLNDGTGTFTLKSQSLCPSDNVTLAVGDVDGDNDLDAFVGNASRHPNLVWLNDGAANFRDSGQLLGNSSSEQVALGDLDGDGDLDGFVGNTTEVGSDPGDKVWFNDGAGVFSDSGQSLGAYDTLGVALGDVDGDGDLDALVGAQGSPNRLLWNGGTVPPMFYVDGTTGNDSGNCRDATAPCATIGYAIFQAVSGGTICVAQGTYTENLEVGGKDLTIRGGYTISDTEWVEGIGETVVDGNATDRVFFIHGNDSVLEDLTIVNGHAPDGEPWGGGIWVTDGNFQLRRINVMSNVNGGVEVNSDFGPTHLTLERSVIAENSGNSGGLNVSESGASADVVNVLIYGNTGEPGGIHLTSGNMMAGELNVVNSTIADNNGSAGIRIEAGGTFTMTNSIVWGNGGNDLECDATCVVTYSDIDGGWTGAGNIDADPQFVDASNGDYHLAAGSPAIDTGTPAGAPTYDIEGTPRDAAPDMGAYEWGRFRIFLPLTFRNFGP